MLAGTNVVLGVSGSIAAVKTVELAHELRRQGAEVRAVMTDSAQGIIHPWALEFSTETPVVTGITGSVEHVELCGYDGWADVLLLAPATANTIGKVANAVDDTPVTTTATTALGAGVPILVAPAMHEPMYDHPGVLAAIERLESWGVEFVEPRLEEGKAKIASEEAIVLDVARAAGDRPLAGKHVVVTQRADERIDRSGSGVDEPGFRPDGTGRREGLLRRRRGRDARSRRPRRAVRRDPRCRERGGDARCGPCLSHRKRMPSSPRRRSATTPSKQPPRRSDRDRS